MTEWQPIETAPRDGTRILAWTGEEIVTVDYHGSYMVSGMEFDGFWYQESESGRGTTFFVTHWMPLPKPPVGEPE
jgi:hypothetical protein